MKSRTWHGRVMASVVAIGVVSLVAAGCSTPTATPTPTKTAAPAAALAKAATCTATDDVATTFKLGTFLPITGNLAFLAPAAIAGGGEALSEINRDGGVLGKPACVIETDSSNAANATVGAASIAQLLQAKVSAILGAESSSTTELVLSTVTASETVMMSPANTDDALTGASPWYFRTAPPNSVEANALGAQILSDGFSKVGFLVFNDSYGTNLRDGISKVLKKGGASVVYGDTGAGQEFPAGQTTFSTEVTAILAAKPDAIVVDAFDETKAIVPALASAGFDTSKLYFVDGNLNDYSDTSAGGFAPGTLTGAQGSTQGVNPDDAFKALLNAWYVKNAGTKITVYGYAAESYDAVMLLALAAVKGGATTSAAIQANLLAVSGSTSGTKCTTYKDCVALIKAGKEIRYIGPSGIGPFNEGHDPSSGFISIYKYDAKNAPQFVSSVKG